VSAIIYERLPPPKGMNNLRFLVVESMGHPQVETECNELGKYAEVDVLRIKRGSGMLEAFWELLKNSNLVLIGFLRLRCPPIPSMDFLASLLLSAQVIKLDKIRRYSIFYGQWMFPAGVSALIAGRAQGKKVINQAHGYDIQVSNSDVKYGLSKMSRRLLSKIAIRRSDIIIVNYEVHRQTALELVREKLDDRIKYLPPPVDIGKYGFERFDREETKKALGMPPDAYVVLFSPHLMRLYGVLDLLDAIPLVLKKNDNVYFLLAGDGVLTDYIINAVRDKNLDRNVKLLGKVRQEMMPRLYGVADIVSDLCYAGQGATTLEALASGIPVIGMRSRRHLIKDGYNGYLVTPGDPSELAEKITTILEKPELSTKLRLNARASAQAFSPKKRAVGLLKLVEEIHCQAESTLNRITENIR
jgi:glycosyltransferase involved in cell wall biosynthesis